MLLSEVIEPVFVNDTKHIGSYNELTAGKLNLPQKKLRICFDLDNTLVTYPENPDDYSTVKPIHKNISLLNNLKDAGHEIIIYTARRMTTHNNNIGKVIKDIALTTINTLETLNVQYDELIFGKQIIIINEINNMICFISFFLNLVVVLYLISTTTTTQN